MEELNRYLSNLSEHHDMYVLDLFFQSSMCAIRVYATQSAIRSGADCHESPTCYVRRMADHEMQAQNWTWIRMRLSPTQNSAGSDDEGI